MKRTLLASFSLLALGWMAGCGGGGGGATIGGAPTPNALSGQYAFVLTGFDASGKPMAMAGSFKADGLGHITAGAVDVNDNGVQSSSSALAGTYAFDTGGQGTIGTITLTNAVGTFHTFAFGFALQSSGASGTIMGLDTNNFIIAGTMQLQTPAAFTLASMAGDYVVALDGRNSSPSAISAIGRLTLGSTGGASSNVVFDRSVAGVGAAESTGGSAAVTFSTTAPDTNGRGTLTVAINDTFGGNTSQAFAYYVVSANRFVAVENDAKGEMTADAGRQSALTATSVNTTGAVFQMAGVDTTVPNDIAVIGQLIVTGSTTGSLLFDSNDNGTILGPVTLSAGVTVAFSSTTGRGTVTVPNGFTNGLSDSLVFYLTAPGTGLILDATTGATNRAMEGTLTAQTGAPFLSGTDLAGLGIVRGQGVSVGNAGTLVGVFGPVANSATYAFVVDQRAVISGTIQTATDGPLSGITLVGLSASTGRGTALLPTTSGNATEVFYIIGLNQFVLMDISPVSAGPNLNGSTPVFFVTPR